MRTPSSSGSGSGSASTARAVLSAVLLGKLSGGTYSARLPSVGMGAAPPPMARELSGVNVSPPAADALDGICVLLSGVARDAIVRGEATKQSAISRAGKAPPGWTRARATVSAPASEERRWPAKSAYLGEGVPHGEGGRQRKASLLLGVADHGSMHRSLW